MNIWLCEANYIKNYEERKLNVTPADIERARSMTADRYLGQQQIFHIIGDEAIISINGLLTLNGPDMIDMFLGINGTAYNDIIDAAKKITMNSEIKDVSINMDTPGGEVSGVDETWQAIRELSRLKNVVVYNKGLIASAGYYLASAASLIIAQSPNAETGSIGVVISMIDYTDHEAAQGVIRVNVVSKNAPNKYPDVKTDEGLTILQERADALERIFIKRVAEGRKVDESHVITSYGKGGLLVAEDPDLTRQDALSVGMIDGVINCAWHSNNINPARAGTKEDFKMSFKKIIEDNPQYKMEYDAELLAKFNAGKESARNEYADRIKRASAYLVGYPPNIQKLAIDVIAGEKSTETLESVVIAYDAFCEKQKSKSAQDETNGMHDTRGNSQIDISQDGVIRSMGDYDIAKKRLKEIRGN